MIDWLRRALPRHRAAGTDLILHLGAHRTGSTAMERLFDAAPLAAQGVAHWTNARVRAIEGFQQVASDGPTPAARVAFAAALGGVAARRLVMFEENILGTMLGNLMAARLYPDLAQNLRRYAALFPAPPLRIGLGIREPASFWTSCWSFVARRRWVPGVEDTAPRIAADPRGWCDVVADLRAAFPTAEILVWPHEGLEPRLTTLGEALADLAPGTLQPLDRRINTSHDAGFLPAMLRLRARNPDLTEDAMRAALNLEAPLPGYSPFTEGQRAAMAQRHARDLDRLAAGHAGARLIS